MPKSPSNNKSVQGSWRGYYMYASSRSRQFGFEAVFLEATGGAVEGSILDSGQLGEARVTGSFGYPQLSFVKIYDNKRSSPVHYQGTMSDDGNTISGRWVIQSTERSTTGSWLMSRIDDHEYDFEEQTDEDSVEQEREKVLVMPASSRGKR